MPVNDGISQKSANYYDVTIMNKTYKVPEDVTILIKSRSFVEKEIIKLIHESSNMIVRYSETEATNFF